MMAEEPANALGRVAVVNRQSPLPRTLMLAAQFTAVPLRVPQAFVFVQANPKLSLETFVQPSTSLALKSGLLKDLRFVLSVIRLTPHALIFTIFRISRPSCFRSGIRQRVLRRRALVIGPTRHAPRIPMMFLFTTMALVQPAKGCNRERLLTPRALFSLHTVIIP